ncbi:bifunctional molybdenum cofactor biosynthesis protein MoaC/MoaB [Niabella insulamsoli]|uniref:bifunctional molybdenum cofactor biosynthesis protein MoaC/MoaB n=1 Tax=Niabella insulamsoli TaxID=3144874 RepID=UPI0031FCD021
MVNITHKSNSLRKAVAAARVRVSSPKTIEAIQNKSVPKGDVFEFSRAAGLLAIKKTSDVIPDCHPLPIESAGITYAVEDLDVVITVEVQTIYKTGVEVEAMHGASITALTMYDMLKPIDKGVMILNIQLLHKKGGKADFSDQESDAIRCAVVVCSDSVAKGTKKDGSGKAILERLTRNGIVAGAYEIIADEFTAIQERARALSEAGYNLILFTGGTGLSPRDVTPDAIKPLLDREIPGIMEAARNYGQQRTPYAMLSRGIAGFINQSLVITLPGSTRGAEETMDALFPYILHLFKVAKGMRHTAS